MICVSKPTALKMQKLGWNTHTVFAYNENRDDAILEKNNTSSNGAILHWAPTAEELLEQIPSYFPIEDWLWDFCIEKNKRTKQWNISYSSTGLSVKQKGTLTEALASLWIKIKKNNCNKK